MKITVYAVLEYGELFSKGRGAGLSDDAADFLSYTEEIELTLDVDEQTGKVLGAEVTQKFE